MNDHEVEVILTPERIKLYERGLPAIVVSMYGDRIQKLIDDEREACAKVADLVAREIDDTNGIATYIAATLRARRQP
jgi:hypothetical protein